MGGTRPAAGGGERDRGKLSNSGPAGNGAAPRAGAFRRHAKFPSEGLAAPAAIEGVTRSDHWPFRMAGFQAIMVTDTAYNRYSHYHLPSDTPEKLDYLRMARVTLGVAAVIKELAHESR